MHNKLLIIAIVFFSLSSIVLSDVSINGYVQMDNRLQLHYDNDFIRNENKLGLKFESKPSDNIIIFSEIKLDGLGFPEISDVSGLQSQKKEEILPYRLQVHEAYFGVNKFITDKLDLRIGRQIIIWGKADKINPTSNICPDDLEDIFNFGEKLGVNSIKAEFYQKVKDIDLTFTGIFVPIFTPSVLPLPYWSKAFMDNIKLPDGINIRNVTDKVTLPKHNISESSSFGAKLSARIFSYDLSLSYYYGRDKLPLVTSLAISPVDAIGTMDALVGMEYPKMQVLGADMAGEIGTVGIWFESALFLPKKTMMTQTLLTPPKSLSKSSIALDDEPYFKFVLGGDYYFTNGLYINTQYVHGFLNERGNDSLNDYLVLRPEYKFHNDEIKLAPISFAIGIDDWNNIKENYGFAYMPEINYMPYDNIELTLGVSLLEGKGNGFFSKVKNNDEFYLKAKASF